MNNPHRIRRLESRARLKKKSAPTVEAWRADCGSDRRRSGDLTIFSRTLYQLSYRALRIEADTQRPRLRDEFLHLNHAARATPTGLEPATTAVKGRRPRPLDDGGLVDANGFFFVPSFEPQLVYDRFLSRASRILQKLLHTRHTPPSKISRSPT